MKTTHLTLLLISIMSSFVIAQEIPTQHLAEPLPPEPNEFVPYEENGGGSNSYSTSSSFSSSGGGQTVSCIEMIKFQREQAGKSIGSDSEEVKKAAGRQTRAGLIGGLGFSAGSGVTAGLVTGNPVIGAGVFGVMGLATVVGTSLEKGRIKRNGNTLIAAEKIQRGEELTKKERRAFEKTRKKVSRKVYKNKYALDSRDFANTVIQQDVSSEDNGKTLNGENLFCDIDRKGRVVIKPQDRQTIKRLALAQKCKEEKRGNRRSIARRR